MAQIPDDQPVGGGWKELDENPKTAASASAAGPMQPAKAAKAPKAPKAPKEAKTVKLGKFEIPVRALAAGGALLAVLVFIFQNRDEAETNFLFVHGSQPLWFVIVVSVLLGGLLGQAVGMLRNRQKKA
jgi:uncharacterized integral membrane protein